MMIHPDSENMTPKNRRLRLHELQDSVCNVTAALKENGNLWNFVGYGNPNGRVWFLGLEEALNRRSPNKILEHLLIRINKFNKIENCRSALEKLNDSRWHDNSNPRLQPTWRWMASIMIGIKEGNQRIQDENALFAYQRDRLGLPHGETLLTELFPLPKPTFNKWPKPYSTWFGFPDATAYRADIEKNRINKVRKLILDHQPEVVICYGKGNDWSQFRELFNDVKFDNGCPGGIWKVGTNPKNVVILTPHFSWFSRKKINNEKGYDCCRQIIGFLRDRA